MAYTLYCWASVTEERPFSLVTTISQYTVLPGFLCRDDCFVKDRVGSRLEIVGIGRFLLRVLYSVLIGPFDVVFHLSVECTVLVRYIGLHINFLNRRYPASVFDGGSFVRDDRERRLFGSYFFQFARRNRAGDENQK